MRTWLITGASSGLGEAISRAALGRGDRVIATARRLDDVAHLAISHPETVFTARLDVTDQASVEEAVNRALAWSGSIDILVNNAGHGLHGAIEEVSHDELTQIFEANVFGLLRVVRTVLPVMRSQGHGHIINMSSSAGLVAAEGSGIYGATKFAVEGISEALRIEVAPLGMLVTVVEPGPFRTEFSGRSIRVSRASIAAYDQTARRRSEALRKNSGKQPGDPERAARIICDIGGAVEAPNNLLLGNLAVDRVLPKLNRLASELKRWEAVSRSADYDDAG